jgi:hypothetical protein
LDLKTTDDDYSKAYDWFNEILDIILNEKQVSTK